MKAQEILGKSNTFQTLYLYIKKRAYTVKKTKVISLFAKDPFQNCPWFSQVHFENNYKIISIHYFIKTYILNKKRNLTVFIFQSFVGI